MGQRKGLGKHSLTDLAFTPLNLSRKALNSQKSSIRFLYVLPPIFSYSQLIFLRNINKKTKSKLSLTLSSSCQFISSSSPHISGRTDLHSQFQCPPPFTPTSLQFGVSPTHHALHWLHHILIARIRCSSLILTELAHSANLRGAIAGQTESPALMEFTF